MADVEYRGQEALDVTVVPARAVYLVREGSRDGFRRAVQEASTRWAGVTEPIVPVSADGRLGGWARRVVELARVDGAVNIDVPDAAARTVAADLGLEVVPLAQIDTAGPVMWTCNPGWVEPTVPVPRSQAYVIAAEMGGLWQAVAAGDLTTAHMAAWDLAVLPVRRGSPDELGRAQLSSGTLLDRTCVSFGETVGSLVVGAASTIVWVTDGDDLRDCWEFWNIRALRPLRCGTLPMILLPRDAVGNWILFPQHFAHALRRGAEFAPDVLLTSLSVDEDDVHEVGELLDLSCTDDEIRRGRRYPASLRQAPFTYRAAADIRWLVDFERFYGESTQLDIHLFRHSTTVRFASPVAFRAGSTLLRFSGAPFTGLPRRPVIAKLVAPAAEWHANSIQLRVPALEHYTFSIHVPSLQESVYALLEEFTTRHQPSDKGSLAAGIQQNIDVAALRQPQVFEVIRQLTTRRTEHFISALGKHFGNGAAVDELKEFAPEWGGRTERRYLSAQDLNGGPKPDSVAALELLCRFGWAERGLEIKCGKCRITSFVRLADVAPGAAVCPGCRAIQDYARAPTVSVFYRLDSLVDRASDQGVIPHILTIAELNRRDPQSWFLPGVDVWFADSDKNMEVDICGVHGGRVVVGEVKTSAAGFDSDGIKKMVAACIRLQADICVMAAVDRIAEESTAEARLLCTEKGLELLVLNDADLRSVPTVGQ